MVIIELKDGNAWAFVNLSTKLTRIEMELFGVNGKSAIRKKKLRFRQFFGKPGSTVHFMVALNKKSQKSQN